MPLAACLAHLLATLPPAGCGSRRITRPRFNVAPYLHLVAKDCKAVGCQAASISGSSAKTFRFYGRGPGGLWLLVAGPYPALER